MLSLIVPHPLGSALERWVHRATLASSAASAAAAPTTALALVWAGAAWWAWLACRLFAFELAFDALFYVAHRGVHAVPALYRAVHKLHHSHTHDLRLPSALQMSAADAVSRTPPRPRRVCPRAPRARARALGREDYLLSKSCMAAG